MASLRYLRIGFLLLLAVLPLVGCSGGGGRGPVRGKILKGGKPISVTDKGMVQVRLVADTNVYSGKVESDGSFNITGNDGKGVPAGSYKVAVLAMDPYPTKDLLAGKFSETKTPITRDIKPGEELVIDLDKP